MLASFSIGGVQAQGKPPEGAPAGSLDEAQSRYKRALELFNEGSYDAALLEFRRAYELAPNWKLLYNIGQVYRQLNDYARALDAFDRYLKEGGADVPPARLTEVKDQIDRLQGRVATLEITSNVAGAEVTVDDFPVGKTPFAKPVVVNAGRRKLGITASGKLPQTRIIELAGSDKQKISFELLSPESERPVASVTAPPTATAPPSHVFWPGWIATGALGVGTAVVGILALSATKKFDDKQDSFGVSRSDLDAAHSKSTQLSVVTDVLLGATLVAGGLSLYLTLHTPPAPSAGSASGASLGLRLGPGQASLLGSF